MSTAKLYRALIRQKPRLCSLDFSIQTREIAITSTVTDYKGTHTWVFTTGTTYQDTDIEYIQAALYNVFAEYNETCEPIVNYVNNTFIITDIYSC